MDYQIKQFSQINEELKLFWLSIEKNSNHSCFNSLAWMQNYFYSYNEILQNSKLRIFVVFSKNDPVCILPFQIIKRFRINILQWAGDSKSDFNAPLQKKNFKFDERAFRNIWNKILLSMPEVDIIYLKKQINFLETFNPFVNYLDNSKEGNIQQIYLPNKWDYYTNTYLKKKFYSDLLRTKRLIKKAGKIEFLIAKNFEEKIFFLEALIKQKKRKLIKNKVISLNMRDLNFYKNFEKFKNKQHITQVSAIKLNGEFIAMHWGIVSKNCFYYLMPSMKEDGIKNLSPGKLLLSLLIRWSISKKLKFFDFGFGEEPYKRNWSNKTITISNHLRIIKFRSIIFYLILKFKQKIKLIKNYSK